MEFELKFECDNAAFAEDYAGEVARILKLVASQVERGSRAGRAVDAYGNTVGYWTLSREEI